MRHFILSLRPRAGLIGCALLVVGALMARSAGAGVGGYADPDEIAAHVRGANLQLRALSINLQRARWLGLHRPAAPADARLTPPAGDWTDLRVPLDGPVTLTLEGPRGLVTWQLDLGEDWTIPLEDPEAAGPLALTLDLPAWAAALGDLSPDHPLHDAIARAVRDGASLSPR